MSTYSDADGDTVRLDSIERAIADIRDGKAVVVVDDPGRENEGDIIFAASKATPELMGFLIRHSSGYVCAPAPGAVLDRLGIPLMTPHNRELMRTAYTISIDARDGITTGISAADRARTVRVLADSATESFELVMPGHVLPLRAKDGGVLARAGHTEAAVDLTRLAGLTPVGVIGEVVHDDGELMRAPALRAFADEHDLALVSIEDLQVHLRLHESQVERLAETSLPTEFGSFRALGYREGAGVVVYLRGHEGRGIGLLHKLQAYALQDAGSDTVDANLALGFGEDERDYAAGAQMLRDLGLRSVRLLTNNPDKATQLEAYGVKVAERVPIQIEPTPENIQYLRTKAERMGHDLPGLGLGDTTTEGE